MENGDPLSVRRLRPGAATGGFLFKRKQSGGKVPTLYKKNRTDLTPPLFELQPMTQKVICALRGRPHLEVPPKSPVRDVDQNIRLLVASLLRRCLFWGGGTFSI